LSRMGTGKDRPAISRSSSGLGRGRLDEDWKRALLLLSAS
jgi:hypothetical protein